MHLNLEKTIAFCVYYDKLYKIQPFKLNAATSRKEPTGKMMNPVATTFMASRDGLGGRLPSEKGTNPINGRRRGHGPHPHPGTTNQPPEHHRHTHHRPRRRIPHHYH